MNASIHPNSLAAHADGERGPFSKREQAILRVLPVPVVASDRCVAQSLGFSDMNAVRHRITELIERGVLVEFGSIKDLTTGKRVRSVGRPQRQAELQLGERRAS